MKNNYLSGFFDRLLIFAAVFALAAGSAYAGGSYQNYPGPQPGSGGGAAAAVSAPAFIQMKASTAVRGATNTNILRFQTVIDSGGTGITRTDTAADGTYLCVDDAGWYGVWGSAANNGSMGVKVSSTVNNDFDVTNTDLPMGYSANTVQNNQSGDIKMAANDCVWIGASGALTNYPEMYTFGLIGPKHSIAE